MKKYKVWVVAAEERMTEDIIINGFANTEKKCVELLHEYISNYPDTEVHVQDKESWYFENEYVYQKDAYGDEYFRKAVYREGSYLWSRLLTKDERKELDELRNEVERHISDLSDDEMKMLYKEVSFGSMYLADYRNSFYIDEHEVCDFCDDYLSHLGEDESENTVEAFVEYGALMYCK